VGQTVTIATNCGTIGGAAVSLGTGTGCPVLSVANNCTGTSQFAVQTNASLGYNVSYLGTTLTGPSDTITETGAAGVVSTIATKQFGIAGTAIAGSGTGAWNATYNFGTNGSKYTFQNATTTSLATAGGPMAENVFTVTYMANISNITKPGLYTSTFNYVCTGNF
jgi:hypothetical protein